MKTFFKKPLLWITALCLLLILIGYLIWGNLSIKTTNYKIVSNRLPQGFTGFRIAQISDLHNTEFGKDNHRLLSKLKEIQPDIIVLTGDLIDSRRTDCNIAIDFARQAVEIAPTYYVPGNHESRISQRDALYEGLFNAGVTLLLDDSIILTRGQDRIQVSGILDPDFRTENPGKETAEIAKGLMPADGKFTILLSHRPEQFAAYKACGVDLVLTGHAHGGQIRLPFIGGLFAPGQGFFPKYDAGLFTENSTHMVISRGLGNSAFPLRVNNRPEIVLIELKSE